jgi:hypothetical protein
MNDINVQIIEDVISSPTIASRNNREELSHLIRNHDRSFGGATSLDLSNMTLEQKLMLLYYWVADGYRNGDLTKDQIELLRNPAAVIKKRLLKEDKDSLTHKLWHGAIRSKFKDDPEPLRQVSGEEWINDLIAQDDAFERE